MAFWLISPVLPAKLSAAGSPGRGGARERSQFSPSGGNGDKRTLRRRAATGKVGRRPQAAKSPLRTANPIRNLPPHPPRIRSAPSPRGKALEGGGEIPLRRKAYPLIASIKNGLYLRSCSRVEVRSCPGHTWKSPSSSPSRLREAMICS